MNESGNIQDLRHVLAVELNGARGVAKALCRGWEDYHLRQTYSALRSKIHRALDAAAAGRTVHVSRCFGEG